MEHQTQLKIYSIYIGSKILGSTISGLYEIGRYWYKNAQSRLENNQMGKR